VTPAGPTFAVVAVTLLIAHSVADHGTGAYALDQSWHLGWLGVVAVVTAVL
jgi:hypothetical protein